MPLRITISSATRATELLDHLRHLGVDAHRESVNVLRVTRRHPPIHGEPGFQDRIEMEFLLRAWASERPDADFEIEEAA